MAGIRQLFLAVALVTIPIQGRLFNATMTSDVFGAIAEIDTNLTTISAPSLEERIVFGSTYIIRMDESHSGGVRGIYLCSVINDTHFYMLDKNGGDLDNPDTISPYYTPLGNGSYTWLVPIVPTGQYVLLPQNNEAVYGMSPYFWLGASSASTTAQAITSTSLDSATPTTSAIPSTVHTVSPIIPATSILSSFNSAQSLSVGLPSTSSTTKGALIQSSSISGLPTINQASTDSSAQTSSDSTSPAPLSTDPPSIGVIVGSICALIAILAAVMIWLLCFIRKRRQPYGLDMSDFAARYQPAKSQTLEPQGGLGLEQPAELLASEGVASPSSQSVVAELPAQNTATRVPIPPSWMSRVENGRAAAPPESPVAGRFDAHGHGGTCRPQQTSVDTGPFELSGEEI